MCDRMPSPGILSSMPRQRERVLSLRLSLVAACLVLSLHSVTGQQPTALTLAGGAGEGIRANYGRTITGAKTWSCG